MHYFTKSQKLRGCVYILLDRRGLHVDRADELRSSQSALAWKLTVSISLYYVALLG